ncbi:hypothetical protein [Paenibacillus jilunlii]|uniref:CDP-Glycerol:Poly(Glycerophosphate) glycerophosphotransferase n=1 Tax=Paenibacillus jilunlii TaxID=682956 RepID=A0A1G9VP84_9BACL|nr:hypothetical protein [Paenibacillus jilunlii]SDM73937.1 hypothetical protein SAMN05216191_11789 [Paenibacillus jilunlii]
MRKHQQEQIQKLVTTLYEATDEINRQFSRKNIPTVINLLRDCQDAAIHMGEFIENFEGEDTRTVELLTEYHTSLYNIAMEIETIHVSFIKQLKKELRMIENSIRNELKPNKIEVAFFPYKASMWDSLESVWMAANEDAQCDAYVVPIPYYDRKPGGSFGEFHYEGGDLPDYVPVTHYESYDISIRRPDVIYIHNPYDIYNTVTSVDPRFYSHELKKYTDTLVYIPYYSTSGGMSEGQKSCSAYYHADYIITQAEKYRGFFDSSFSKKLLPLGSPKFDRVVRICNNPPEPPAAWKAKMTGKKVYFYNTSINGLLSNTQVFLKKMQYVFSVFAAHDDVCLLWRPHPLLESTLDSMRPEFKQIYSKIKRFFIENDIGIYDDTPDVANTIALCDAYIGDSGTSVVSLFGIAGKPIFILDNNINTEPVEDDWRGEMIIRGFNMYTDDKWLITRGNKLYYSPDNNYKYQYLCDLSDHAYGDYYAYTLTFGNETYICPRNAQDIIILNENKISKRIRLKKYIERPGSFSGAVSCGKYIFLIPLFYPAIVRYNTANGEIKYFDANLDIIIGKGSGERLVGGFCVQNGYLFIASPVDNRVLAIEAESGKEQVLTTGGNNAGGCMTLDSDGSNLWLMPFSGTIVTCWNPESGEVREYSDFPENLKCRHINFGFECMERPFSHPAFCGDYVYLAPYWSNMYIKLNRVTGESIEWQPPFDTPNSIKNGYYSSWCKSWFLYPKGEAKKFYNLFSLYDRKLYNIDLENSKYEEINIDFNINELKANEPGFKKNSEWLQYCSEESVFNTLSDFLEENITGNAFNKENQIAAYGEIAANNDGTCGKKVHEFIKEHLNGN